jgi:hypothetical protein
MIVRRSENGLLDVYDLIEKKFVISRDVELNEETRWDWKNQQEEMSTEEVEVRLPIRDNGASSSRSSEKPKISGSLRFL